MASEQSPWLFDVTSLMVLLGENEESAFRSARESYFETCVAAPVAGIQSYLKTYDGVPGTSHPTYLSPNGGKSAPLRNMRLELAIRHLRLLKNGNYIICNTIAPKSKQRRYLWFRRVWLIISWLYFGSLIALWYKAPFGVLPKGTWMGITNVAALTGWSITVRTIELALIIRREKQTIQKDDDEEADAVVFLGERNSALVITGLRGDIKRRTTVNRLDYNNGSNSLYQNFTRIGTMLVLLLVFVTVPNGSTTDQLVFVLLNILGQVNVFLGLHINAKRCFRELGPKDEPENDAIRSDNRTQIYGNLLRKFGNGEWVEKTNMLPKTPVWEEWAQKVVVDRRTDPKTLYDNIKKDYERKRDATANGTHTAPPKSDT